MFDANPSTLIKEIAKDLKSKQGITAPEWISYTKTGAHNERPAQQDDFWYMRAASILRVLYKNGPIGVSKLRTKYGGRKENGSKPAHFKKGGGSIIRKILQQLENEELVKKAGKGRVLTEKGISMLDKKANELTKK